MDSQNHITVQNQHLIDHNYNFEGVKFPHQIVDHDYALPVINLDDYEDDEDEEDFPNEVIVDEPTIYKIIPGVQRNTKVYVDNCGYKYYKKKLLVNKITLICERQRNPSRPMCFSTATISRDEKDNRITITTPHNHEPLVIDMNVPLLRDALAERCLDPIRTQSVRSIYNSEITKHQDAAKHYTFKQTQARIKRMRRLRLRRFECDYV